MAKKSKKKSQQGAQAPTDRSADTGVREFVRTHRRELTFVGLFVLLLTSSFTFLSLNAINTSVVEPFTGWVASASGVVLNLLGQGIEQSGTVLRNERFAVNIRNGCNGVETMVIFLSAVLAFPAPWRARIIGLVLGIVAIQGVNLVRVAALFLTGAYYPEFFDSSHTVVWQTIVIAFGVFLWIFWADRMVLPKRSRGEDPSDEPPADLAEAGAG